ncbi:MAG: family 43 glycosylhydrolase [Bacteroidota bacterium]
MSKRSLNIILCGLALASAISVNAQNPLIRNQFTADPSARVFGDSVYIYPSHDIKATPGHGRLDWFCMEDYHVFSSANLTDWKDHGVILSQTKVPWADSAAYSMWAPDCIERNGKYYFYFPATAKANGQVRGGFAIGVAVSDHPYGPFKPLNEPIQGVRGIDPNVFIDKNGQAYLYWAQGNIYAAKLKDNMTELASPPQILAELPEKGLKEGPYLFERNGIYYLTYPHVANKTERLEYAMGDSPLGPFKFTGVIMDESASGCWTNHQSIAQVKQQWLLFYHDKDLSPQFDKNRSIRADSLFFNPDGTIKKVVPSMRGVGLTSASALIQLDRYSALGGDAAVTFLDTLHKFDGWKVVLKAAPDWVRYNSVDFGKKHWKTVEVRLRTEGTGSLIIRLNSADGPVVATVAMPKISEWKTMAFKVSLSPVGVRNLVMSLSGGANAEIDWIRFKN